MSAPCRSPAGRGRRWTLRVGLWCIVAARLAAGQSTVRGVVYDSVARAGHPNASVQLVPVDTPVLVIDGTRVPMHDMNLDDVIPADLVRAVEVSPRRMQAAPEFQGTDCGSLVIRTGLRGWVARPRAGRSP